MFNGEMMEIKVNEEVADQIWKMTMNGGRSKVRDYLASQNVLVPIGWKILDIGCNFSATTKNAYFLVAGKFI